MRVDETIYLDYQAATPVDARVRAAMEPFYDRDFANSHAADHVLGWRAAAAIDAAAADIAQLAGTAADAVVFTSGASEANAAAIFGVLRAGGFCHRRSVIVGAGDHASTLAAAEQAADEVLRAPLTSDGVVDLDWLRSHLSDNVALVSFIGVNNEIGSISDIRAVAELCRAAGVPVHADLAQAPAAIDLAFDEWGLSFATLSSHKIYGPKGVGALLVAPDKRSRLAPLIPGGGQQSGLRGGTLPTMLCAGFGAACRIMLEEAEAGERRKIAALRDRLVRRLLDVEGVELIGPALPDRHPGNATLRFRGVDAADLLGVLQPHIAASSQSACSSGQVEPSHVIQAIGRSADEARECMRLSLGRFSDSGQIDEATSRMAEAVLERREALAATA